MKRYKSLFNESVFSLSIVVDLYNEAKEILNYLLDKGLQAKLSDYRNSTEEVPDASIMVHVPTKEDALNIKKELESKYRSIYSIDVLNY